MKILALLALLSLAGCQLFGSHNSTRDPVGLEATFRSDGARVSLVLTNRTDRAVGYNLCLSPVENQQTGRRFFDPLIDCQASLSLLQSKERAEMTLSFGASDLPSGTYRAVTTVEAEGESREIKSAPFAVR